MAVGGLLPIARTALPVATAVLPPCRRRFSKHQFTPPPSPAQPASCIFAKPPCRIYSSTSTSPLAG